MKVHIIGNKGNMGKRYAAILNYLGHQVCGSDINVEPDLANVDGVIIATPTSTHLPILWKMLELRGIKILCEKPFVNTRDLTNLKKFLKLAAANKIEISMVSQYDYFRKISRDGLETYYDYFKTGSDGLAWDCINIIWHAKSNIKLSNKSPIWRCHLNGTFLPLEFMDEAYIEMIELWLRNPYEPQYQRIQNAHMKVVEYLDGKFD